MSRGTPVSRTSRSRAGRLAAAALSLLAVITAAPRPGHAVAAPEPPLADAAAAVQARPPTVDWRMLQGLNYRTGEVSAALRQVDGKRVRIPGFMVPLEDGADGVDEFLLVPYFGACIHTPPPPPNQIVYVRMERGKKVKVNLWDPIWMEGELRVKEIDSPYGSVGHQLVGITLSPYR
jgi:uncharacterized protein